MSATVRRIRVLALGLLGMLVWPPASHGFRMIQATATGRITSGNAVTCSDPGGFTHWNIRAISWFHNTAGQGAGKDAALSAAMSSWSNVFSSGYAPAYAGTTTAGWATDGLNTILWSTGNGCTGGCLALTALVVQSGQVIIESDITFNAGVTWRTDGGDYDTQAVATHELGHSLGIHHTDVTSTPHPTMYTPYFGSAGRILRPDDGAALTCSECRYCSHSRYSQLTGEGTIFASRRIATLDWCKSCLTSANVDVFRDGVRIATSSNSGAYTDIFFSSVTSANYWVCEAGSTTWYNVNTCSNVTTVAF